MSTYDNNVLYRPLNINNSSGGNIASSVCNWLKHIKVYKIVCMILVLLFVIPMIAHYYILNVSRRKQYVTVSVHYSWYVFLLLRQVENEVSETEIHHSRSQLDVYEDISNLRASDLKLRIEEMLRIKVYYSFGIVK